MSDTEPPHEEEPTQEDTQEIPPTPTVNEPLAADEIQADEESRKKPKKLREIWEDDQGNKFFVYYEKTREQRPESRRFRRKQRYVTAWVRHELHIGDNEYVDLGLIKKIPFAPVASEESILAFNRLHWWSHGPEQILIGFIGTVAITIAAWLTGRLDDPRPEVIVPALLVLLVALSGWYVTVWIPWAYTVLIVTDKRIILVYAPPFALGGNYEEVAIQDVQNISTHDQIVRKWIPAWGNILSKLGLMGYKILRGDTSADDDDWIRNGIKYVRGAEDVQKLISAQRARLMEQGQQQHEEAMNFQMLSLDAQERAAALLEQLVNQSPHPE